MTRRLAALCAAALALVLVGCSSQSQSSNDATGTDRAETSKVIGGTLPADGPAESGGTLTITDPSDAISLDPQKTASVYTHTGLSGVVYSKLLEFKTGRDITPAIFVIEIDDVFDARIVSGGQIESSR